MPDPAAYYEGNYPIQTAGATPDKDKNDDGTRTAWTAWTAWTASILVTRFRDLVYRGRWSISTDSVV